MDLRDLLFLALGLVVGVPSGWTVGLKSYERHPDFWHRVWGVPRGKR